MSNSIIRVLMDFGQDIEYNLNQKGDYSLVIGKSLMADGSQKGKFSVQLK